MLTIYGDFEGRIAADIYNKNPDIVIPHIHLAVFPLEEKSIVLAFYNDDDHEYDGFSSQLSKMEIDDQLAAINFLIWKNTEDMFLNPKFPHKTYFINKISDLALQTSVVQSPTMLGLAMGMEQERMALYHRDRTLPNALSEKYKIKSN